MKFIISKPLLISSFIFFVLASATFAEAKQIYGFSSVSGNYLDWTEKTEKRSEVSGLKRDFAYFEIEGGGGYDWGTLYGFLDIENPGASADNSEGRGIRTASKGAVTVKIYKTNWHGYGHVYQITTKGFQEQNRVLGFAYDFRRDRFWFQPFLGLHDVVSHVETPSEVAASGTSFSGYNGFNGLMLGWLMSVDFRTLGQPFSFFWWHETEVNRNDRYGVKGIHKKNEGHNGALSFWWKPEVKYSLGLQYRYADHKLGTPSYQDASIFTLKYNL
ncbi:MAG: hypothetical protein KDD61_05435 [Bdellovibrionales bacterium]|nr:hypothetical protein [Bdellovibrionales bacterium]